MEKSVDAIAAKPKAIRIVAEVLVLTTVAWIAHILVQDDPAQGVNVRHWGAKWIAYTYTGATVLYVAPPAAIYTAIVTLVCLLRWRRPSNYWLVYRVGFVLAVVWAVLGNYGSWYGSCRQHNDVAYCQGSSATK